MVAGMVRRKYRFRIRIIKKNMFKNPTYQECHFGHHQVVKANDFTLDNHITYFEYGGQKRSLKNCPLCDELFFVEYDFAFNDRDEWKAIFIPVPSVMVANYLNEYAPYYVNVMDWTLSSYFKEPPIFPAYIYLGGNMFRTNKDGRWVINSDRLNDLAAWKDWCRKKMVLL